LFFVFLIFPVQSCGSLFSLYKPPLWNLIIVSWSVRETKQNGIFSLWNLMTIWVFKFFEWWCFCCCVSRERRREEEEEVYFFPPWPRGSHIFCLLCCLFWHPLLLTTPLFLFKSFLLFFSKILYLIFRCFIYLFYCFFFFLSTHICVQHY